MMQVRIALLLCLSIGMAGCGSSSKKNTSSGGPVSGNWQMALLPNGKTLAKKQSGFLLQSGSAVTGNVLFLDPPCSGIGSVTGSVNGTNVSLAINPTGVQISLTGTIGSDQASMSGTFTLLQAGCSGTSAAPLAGTWTANLVAPLNGTIQGSFTSKEGVVYQVGSGSTLSQGPNTGVSSVPLAGNISVSSDTPYCFTGATITGSVSGTALALNLLNADGTQLGNMNGTTSLDGTSVTGTYSILAQGTGTGACGGGDGGTFTFSL